eukprot:scaffold75153_cov30-Phaeocystis_antarctica.AAC.1
MSPHALGARSVSTSLLPSSLTSTVSARKRAYLTKEGVLLAAAVGGVLVLEVLEAERQVEDHARAEDLVRVKGEG